MELYFYSFFYMPLSCTPVKLRRLANKNSKKSIACSPYNCDCRYQRKANRPLRFKTSVDAKKGGLMENTFTIT